MDLIILKRLSQSYHIVIMFIVVLKPCLGQKKMNRVFGWASDIGVEICFQDTDPIHLKYEDVDKVVKMYKEKYGLDLVGEELGKIM